jgi:hypothetical protein
MPGLRKRGEEIRGFILQNVTQNNNIAALTAERFGITLPAVYKHIDRLVSENLLAKQSGQFVLQSARHDFDKTVVPVRLANSDDLMSRSQAWRILNGLELFKEVILDFNGIEYIGQAFADEIFRVFPNMNPNTAIMIQNANTAVQNMANRAKNTKL